jgi:hypothetical protein
MVLAKGHTDWSLTFEAANDIRLASLGARTVREDYEIDRLVARYRFGIREGTDLTVELPLVSRNGGFLDGFIDFWHQSALGIKNNIRTGLPYGRSFIDLPGHARFGSAAGIGDLTISLAQTLNPRLMGIVALKLPTGSAKNLLGSGAADLGGALQWKVPMDRRWDFYVQGGLVFQGESSTLPEARKTALQGALTLAYRADSRNTYLGQWQAEPSSIVTGVPGSDTSHRMVSLAWRRKLSEGRYFEAFMLEDGDFLQYRIPEFANIAPDLTLGVRWIWRN